MSVIAYADAHAKCWILGDASISLCSEGEWWIDVDHSGETPLDPVVELLVAAGWTVEPPMENK